MHVTFVRSCFSGWLVVLYLHPTPPPRWKSTVVMPSQQIDEGLADLESRIQARAESAEAELRDKVIRSSEELLRLRACAEEESVDSLWEELTQPLDMQLPTRRRWSCKANIDPARTKTFVKFEGSTPSFLEGKTQYDHSEILTILATDEWTDPDFPPA